MSPRKQSDNDAFISISKEEFFDSFTAVRDAVTKLTTAIEDVAKKLEEVKKTVDSHDIILQKYDRLENRVIGGWLVLACLGIGSLFMMKIYLESIVRNIVVDVVSTADFQEIDNK